MLGRDVAARGDKAWDVSKEPKNVVLKELLDRHLLEKVENENQTEWTGYDYLQKAVDKHFDVREHSHSLTLELLFHCELDLIVGQWQQV